MRTVFIVAALLAVMAAALITHKMVARGRFWGQCDKLTKGIFWLLFLILSGISAPLGFLFGGTFGGGIGALLGNITGVFEAQITILGVALGIFAATFFFLEALVILLAILMTLFVRWKGARIGQ